MEALSPEQQINSLRSAQFDWSQVAIRQRAATAKRLASLIAGNARLLHDSIQTPQRSDYRETIAAEIFPFADAARWLSKNAHKVLKTRNVGFLERPMWLGRVRSVVSREPVGVVLVIGTWNYPLFLTGVQMLQAVVAGNAVIVKPAPGCEAITVNIQRLMIQSGVPSNLIAVLDTSIEAVERIIDQRVDRAIMTGSSESGRKVLSKLAQRLTPSTMELSGCDAVFVLDNANIERVTAALLFGLRLNGGATCVAPRRVYIPKAIMPDLVSKLRARLNEIPSTVVPPKTLERIESEIAAGHAKLVLPPNSLGIDQKGSDAISRWLVAGLPVVLEDVALDSPLANADIFAPLTMLFAYDDIEQALQLDRQCRYGLTASIFGGEEEARRLAARLDVGSVVVNDLIVPTADPRLPFGGVRESGFGVTRGVEGLLELTRPKVVSVRRGRWLLHLDAPKPRDGQILEGLLQWLHEGSWTKRIAGLANIIRAVTTDSRKKESRKSDT